MIVLMTTGCFLRGFDIGVGSTDGVAPPEPTAVSPAHPSSNHPFMIGDAFHVWIDADVELVQLYLESDQGAAIQVPLSARGSWDGQQLIGGWPASEPSLRHTWWWQAVWRSEEIVSEGWQSGDFQVVPRPPAADVWSPGSYWLDSGSDLDAALLLRLISDADPAGRAVILDLPPAIEGRPASILSAVRTPGLPAADDAPDELDANLDGPNLVATGDIDLDTPSGPLHFQLLRIEATAGRDDDLVRVRWDSRVDLRDLEEARQQALCALAGSHGRNCGDCGDGVSACFFVDARNLHGVRWGDP